MVQEDGSMVFRDHPDLDRPRFLAVATRAGDEDNVHGLIVGTSRCVAGQWRPESSWIGTSLKGKSPAPVWGAGPSKSASRATTRRPSPLRRSGCLDPGSTRSTPSGCSAP